MKGEDNRPIEVSIRSYELVSKNLVLTHPTKRRFGVVGLQFTQQLHKIID